MATAAAQNLPPAPSDERELRRVDHTRLRRRLIYGEAESDAARVIDEEVGFLRGSVWGKPDLSANPYLSIWSQVAALYRAEPDVATAPGSEAVSEAVADAGWWTLAGTVQRDTLAMREMIVRLDYDDEAGMLRVRSVFPDMVAAESAPRCPSVPLRVREWVSHPVYEWVQLDADVRDQRAPSYRAVTRDGVDVSEDVLGASYVGEAYPFRDSSGVAILPYVIIHASDSGWLWDPYTMREVVDGSLRLIVYLTYYGHILRNAAWAQRWALGAEPDAAEVVDDEGHVITRKEVPTDPTSLLIMRQIEGLVGQAQVGQWSSPIDPEAVLRAISMYERRVLTLAGLSAPDVTRTEADIRSGYSLAVSRESVREVQRAYEPMFRRADQEIMRVAACMLNRARGTSYSEDPRSYRITYRGLPRSPVDTRAALDEVAALMSMGLASPVDAWLAVHPGATREEALAALQRVQAESALLRQTPTP